MRKNILLIVCIVLLISVCGGEKSPAPIYTKDSNEYKFFKSISDSLQITVLNPKTSNELIRTQKFSVWTNDVMPAIYQQLSRYNLKSIPKEQIILLVQQIAKQEARKKLLLIAAEDKNVTISEDTLQQKLELLYKSSGTEEEFLRQISQRGFPMKMKDRYQKNVLFLIFHPIRLF